MKPKRILSILLTGSMLLSLLPVSALAAAPVFDAPAQTTAKKAAPLVQEADASRSTEEEAATRSSRDLDAENGTASSFTIDLDADGTPTELGDDDHWGYDPSSGGRLNLNEGVFTLRPSTEPNAVSALQVVELYIEQKAEFNSGTVGGAAGNGGTISGGTFQWDVSNIGTISGGTFQGGLYNHSGTISGGTFQGNVGNWATISGGTFQRELLNYGTISDGIFQETVANNGTISDGIFQQPVDNYKTISGGTFQKPVYNYANISGGTFKDAAGKPVDVSAYLVAGKQQNSDGSVGNKSYYYYPSTTDTKTDTTTKGSPKTFDAGVGIYAVTAVLSVTGMAWTAKKRH